MPAIGVHNFLSYKNNDLPATCHKEVVYHPTAQLKIFYVPVRTPIHVPSSKSYCCAACASFFFSLMFFATCTILSLSKE